MMGFWENQNPIFFLLQNDFCGNQTTDLVKEEGLILRESKPTLGEESILHEWINLNYHLVKKIV
jgi:hypothetical protein